MLSIRPYGDQALLVEFELRINPATNDAVVALARALAAAAVPGLGACTPAYCSLTVGYDPAVLPYSEAEKLIIRLNSNAVAVAGASRLLRVPVCYEADFAPDLTEVTAHTGLSAAEVIRLHTTTEFRVYMLGFLPGFAYLGRLPAALDCPRKTTPRLRVPAQAVGLAGLQTGIYPVEAPGGWQLIGRTPLAVFDAGREQPFLFQAGDRVQFEAVSSAEFAQLATHPTAALGAVVREAR